MLEVDDLAYPGLEQSTRKVRTGGCGGGGDNDGGDDSDSDDQLIELVGLEEQIEREERSEERRENKRARVEATRKAVCEALALWSSKAGLLQVGVQEACLSCEVAELSDITVRIPGYISLKSGCTT